MPTSRIVSAISSATVKSPIAKGSSASSILPSPAGEPEIAAIDGLSLTETARLQAANIALRPPAPVAIDWEREPDLCLWLPRNLYRRCLTQMIFGERWVSGMCEEWSHRAPSRELSAFLERQRVDEEQHAALLKRYLARIGTATEIDHGLHLALQSVATTEDILAQFLAIYLVLENEAIHILRQSTQCLLFQQICQRILLDEARHVSFGKTVLRPHLARLSDERRIALYTWLEWLWRGSANSQIETLLGPFARPARRVVGKYLDHRWRRIEWSLWAIGLLVQPG